MEQLYIRCPRCSNVYEVMMDECPKCGALTMVSESQEIEPVFNLND